MCHLEVPKLRYRFDVKNHKSKQALFLYLSAKLNIKNNDVQKNGTNSFQLFFLVII